MAEKYQAATRDEVARRDIKKVFTTIDVLALAHEPAADWLRKPILWREPSFQVRSNPSGSLGVNPGKTGSIGCPRCPRTNSPSTLRKSVVTARSRRSKSCSGSRPGQRP